jgi:hypothetical protein
MWEHFKRSWGRANRCVVSNMKARVLNSNRTAAFFARGNLYSLATSFTYQECDFHHTTSKLRLSPSSYSTTGSQEEFPGSVSDQEERRDGKRNARQVR